MVDTSGATLGKTYRFRIINGSTTAALDTYANYPTLTIISSMTDVERYTKEARGGVASTTT